MYIVGIDAALNAVGIAVTDGDNVLKISYFEPTARKYRRLATNGVAYADVLACRQAIRHILAVTEAFGDKVIIASELPPGGAISARAARCLGIMTGALAALQEMGKHIVFLTPQQVRKILLDNGRASKADIQALLADVLAEHLIDFPSKAHSHIYDALAVAFALQRHREARQ